MTVQFNRGRAMAGAVDLLLEELAVEDNLVLEVLEIMGKPVDL